MRSRTIQEVLADYRTTIEKVDPRGEKRAFLQNNIRSGKLDPAKLTGDHLHFYRLTRYLRFLEREVGRIAQSPEQLRPIALAEPLDNEVRTDVLKHLNQNKPKQVYLELLNPLKSAPDAARVRTLRCDVKVRSIEWHPKDSRLLASGSDDGTIIIWNAVTGLREGESLRGHTKSVTSVSWSPDGSHIASGSDDTTVRIWEVVTRKTVCQPFRGHTDKVTSVSWSPDGRFLASGSEDATVIIWDAVTGQKGCSPLRGHTGKVTSVSWSPDGRFLASGSTDNAVIIWDAITKQSAARLTGHTHWVCSVSWSPDSRFLASGSHGNVGSAIVIIWDAKTGRRVRELSRIWDYLIGMCPLSWSPDSRFLTLGNDSCLVTIWDATTGQLASEPLQGHMSIVTSVSWSPDGRFLASGEYRGVIIIWDAVLGKQMEEPDRGLSGDVYSMSWSPDGRFTASKANSNQNNSIIIWDVEKGQPVRFLFQEEYFETVYSLSWSSDGGYLALGSSDQRAMILDLKTGQLACEPIDDFDGNSLTLSPDGCHIALSCKHNGNNTIMVLNTVTGQSVGKLLKGHKASICSISWSPNGQYLVSGGADGKVIIWDAIKIDRLRKPLRGHTGNVNTVSWSRQGRFFASSGDDGTVIIWDVLKQKRHVVLRGHTDSVTSVSWNPNGNELASCSSDGTVIIWDFTTRMPIIRFPLESRANCVAWDPSKRNRLAVGQEIYGLRIYQFHPPKEQSFEDTPLF